MADARIALFDAYLIIDWSAASRPKTGRDSIWYALIARHKGQASVVAVENPATRRQAIAAIRRILLDGVRRNRVTLVGFDFPYAYPAGLAAALELAGEPWLAIWRRLAESIRDDENNRNNRFDVAAAFNRRISGGCGPFWGLPAGLEIPGLGGRKPVWAGLPERRFAEGRARGSQPAWKLAYPGSAGSQSLVGIPYLLSLTEDPVLKPVSRVWPFQTGLSRPETGGWKVLHAEIYPSLLEVRAGPNQVKDQAQVIALGLHLASLDIGGRLAAWLAGPRRGLSPGARKQIEREEGWILGVV